MCGADPCPMVAALPSAWVSRQCLVSTNPAPQGGGGPINSSKLPYPGRGNRRHLPQATQSKKEGQPAQEGKRPMVGWRCGGRKAYAKTN